MYDIRLYSRDIQVQPTAEVEVQIPTNDRTEKKSVAVYAADNGKNPRRISSMNPKGYRFFMTEHVGVFALTLRAGTAGTFEPETGNNTDDVTLLEETEVDLGKDPDRLNEELSESQGETEKPREEEVKQVAKSVLLDDVAIPLEQLKREANPKILLFAAGIFVLAALLTALGALFGKKGRKSFSKQAI